MTQMKVEYLYHSGSDLDIINAAYASFSKVATKWDATQHPRLMRYLARGMSDRDYEALVTDVSNAGFEHNIQETISDDYRLTIKDLLEQYRHTPIHHSPFSHVSVSLRLKAPIAIHAQFMKHTVGFSHNTTSRRYVSSIPEFFTPTFRYAPSGNVKQGSGEDIDKVYIAHISSLEKGITNNTVLLSNYEDERLAEVKKLEVDGYDCSVVEYTQNHIKKHFDECMNLALKQYEYFLSMGIAPEQARFILPQGVMTEWQTTGSLYGWARLYNQRTDSHAQKEIQDLAHMVGDIIKPLYPHAWDALVRS